MQDKWNAVDDYVSDRLLPGDSTFEAILQANADAGLPPHDVSPAQGRLLELLARAIRAKAILEIGTLGGYSTVWLARGLGSGGCLVTLEACPKHAEVAERNLREAGLSGAVTVRLGPAVNTMREMIAKGAEPFDFIFIDADKANNADYFRLALRLSRIGTVIVADNTVRNGDLANPSSTDPSTQGVRRFHEVLAETPFVLATTIQTVGCKGYDGFTMAVVLGIPSEVA